MVPSNLQNEGEMVPDEGVKAAKNDFELGAYLLLGGRKILKQLGAILWMRTI